MIRLLSFALLYSLSFVLVLPAAEPAAPVAMVLTAKGEVTLQRGEDKPQRLRAMDLVRPGDKLAAAAEAEATLVFLADGRRERLKSKARAAVGEKGCTPAESVQKLENAPLTAAN